MAQLRLTPAADTSVRRVRTTQGADWGAWKQAKGEEHLIGGFKSDKLEEYRAFLNFVIPWASIKEITAVTLQLFTVNDHAGVATQAYGGNNLVIQMRKNPWTASGGNEGGWTGAVGADDFDFDPNYVAYKNVSATNGHLNQYGISNIIGGWAPKNIKVTGKAGAGKSNYGLILRVTGSSPDYYAREWVVASDDHSNVALRPVLVIDYIPVSAASVTVAELPVGDVAITPDLAFTGHYEPGSADQHLSNVHVQVLDHTTGALQWETTPPVAGSGNDTATNTFSVPVPVSLTSLKSYDWRARVQNQFGVWTGWSDRVPFRKTSAPPTLTLLGPAGPYETLAGVTFQAMYADPEGPQEASRAQVQVRGVTTPGDPLWDSGGAFWDSGLVQYRRRGGVLQVGAPPTPGGTRTVLTPDGELSRIQLLYQGKALAPGSYSFRMRAADQYDATSAWVYGSFSLTKGYEPSPGDTNYLTGYERRRQRFRIRIFGMGPNRAPGKLLAELYDAANVGASESYNSAGEFFFTLPAIHPQVSVIEPYQTHFSFELYRGEGWKPVLFGLMTDFDATEDEVVFYGTDYPGVLGMVSDDRYNLADPDLPVEKGGAKYVDDTIGFVITDQLNKAKAAPNSPVGFISVGDIVAMTEKVTIFATFKERLSFIAGLIDSHRAGTGVNTRLICQRNADSSFEWRIVNRQVNRDNLRLEYGSLIQGFQVIPFGQWGTRVHGIGRTSEGTKPFYAKEVAPGISEAFWGSYPRVNVWTDLEDLNDLTRRTKQAAISVAKIGKRMALGIRVDTLDIKDGWDITDSLPVKIQRGVVDTTRYGSGYWTIWGWSWQSYPDGHSDTNLTILPREDSTPPDPDLIPSVPILDTPEWGVDTRPPTESDPENWWVDLSDDGSIWEKQPDGTWEDTGEDLAGPPGPPGPPGAPGTGGDTTAPPVPVIKGTPISVPTPQPDGTVVTAISVVVGYPSPPVGLNDLSEYILQSTRFAVGGVPDWTSATQWHARAANTLGVADPQGLLDVALIQPNVLAAQTYYLRVAAADLFNNVSVWSAFITYTTVADTLGPPQPVPDTLIPGMSVIGIHWPAILADDFAYVEVQWGASPATTWLSAQVPGTTYVIANLTNDVAYDVRVRSVDRSGNTTDPLDGLTYDVANPGSNEKGWVVAGTATPTKLPGSALAWTDAIIASVFAHKINADWIEAGNLKIGTGAADADAITIYDSKGNVLGRWSSATGIQLFDPPRPADGYVGDPNFKMTLDSRGLLIWDMTNAAAPVIMATIGPEGIDAASITFGSARGGHNLLQNSSFELGQFVQPGVGNNKWDVAADWNGTRIGSDTNITTAASTLAMTAT